METEFEIGVLAHRVGVTVTSAEVPPILYEFTERDAVEFARDFIKAIRDLRELGGTHADLDSLLRELERK